MEKDRPTITSSARTSRTRNHHLAVACVKWADKADAIKVTVRKGTQFGDVQFRPQRGVRDQRGRRRLRRRRRRAADDAQPGRNLQPGGLRRAARCKTCPGAARQRFARTAQHPRNRPPVRAPRDPGAADAQRVITPAKACQ